MPLHPPLPVALARVTSTFPPGEVWSWEPKFDGWRGLIFRTPVGVAIQARSGRLITASFPDLVTAALGLPASTVIDGEIVVWHRERVDFGAVQRRALANPRRAFALSRVLPASFAAFDVLELEGVDMRPRPYRERRAALLELLADVGPPIQPVPASTAREDGRRWWDTRGVGIEGVMVKHLEAPYRGGVRSWRKVKHGEPRRAGIVSPKV
ncbi:ATP-dependent DNA ligase [Streptomyces sp. DSM 42041]|uniref:ATP-dependent DNA ligase n=1 Tax=Streptomyces hazeniae TaxID=3075538 RepID=A0ABU2NJN8_9ACTN|nr:ATP-dependent DNA ligase [Streptomyces sp. DSM 42041]MDT0377206.1 ATP-dependent DNA ligase [Streptomyces sp. DSM 42041]